MSANLQPITSDGGFITTGNVSGNYFIGNGSQLTGISGGGGNSISDGGSNVTVVSTGGNVVIGVDNDAASWTFATDGIIYNKTEADYKVLVTDPNGDGYAVKHYVNDGTQDVTLTSLDESSFRIYTNLDGAGEEWRFSGNTLQVSTNSTIRAFDSNVIIESMSAGGTDIASLRSVSNQNDPNIFTTFDATPTGANIIVYNGGSSGGTGYTWQFDNNGNLTLPGNTFSVNYANGTQVSIGGSYGDSNVVTLLSSFGSNTITTTGNVSVGNISATNLGNISSVNLTGSASNVLYGNGTFAAPVAEASFSIQTANFNANAGSRYGVNTSSGAVTATLPASPATGAAIFFADAGGAYASNNLTIARNGQTIMGASSDLTVSTNNQSVGLFYNGTTWRTYNAG